MNETTPTRTIIGLNVRRLREKAGMTVIECAALWGKTRGSWYLLEKGALNTPLDNLTRIAEILQTTPTKLMQARNGKRKAA